MAASFKIFVQVAMILLALDLPSPGAVCATGLSQVAKSSCCNCGMVCKCHHDKSGSNSCNVARAPSSDKSIPARSALAPSPRVDASLFTMVPARAREWVFLSAFHRPGLNASPPFGGSPPQAMLCLWLI
jgi:hypothetical protein